MYVGFGGSYDLGPSKGMTGSSRWGQVPNGQLLRDGNEKKQVGMYEKQSKIARLLL